MPSLLRKPPDIFRSGTDPSGSDLFRGESVNNWSRADLEIYQGDSYEATVTVSNPDGTDADLTDATAESQIRRGPADSYPLVVAFTVEILMPNLILLSLTGAQTTALTGDYMWDLELTTPERAPETLLWGAVAVQPEVTR